MTNSNRHKPKIKLIATTFILNYNDTINLLGLQIEKIVTNANAVDVLHHRK